MKRSIKNIVAILAIGAVFTACSSSEDATVPTDELAGLNKFKEITNDTHTLELYSHRDVEQGYNEIKIRIKDNATNNYVKDAEINWTPLMHMSMMTHSCPKSAVEKVTSNGTLYEGYIVFQMPQNETEYWDLTLDYTIKGISYTATTTMDVPASAERRVTTFTGTDGIKYIVAYAEPHHPKVAVNDVILGVFKMQDMMHFPVVDGYTLKIDPRMPSMGNHGSPNNMDAVQLSPGELYTGKMALTMTGYWKINLQLFKSDGTLLKGEPISDTVTESSLYLDLEF